MMIVMQGLEGWGRVCTFGWVHPFPTLSWQPGAFFITSHIWVRYCSPQDPHKAATSFYWCLITPTGLSTKRLLKPFKLLHVFKYHLVQILLTPGLVLVKLIMVITPIDSESCGCAHASVWSGSARWWLFADGGFLQYNSHSGHFQCFQR